MLGGHLNRCPGAQRALIRVEAMGDNYKRDCKTVEGFGH
jgi:hypothetical protein